MRYLVWDYPKEDNTIGHVRRTQAEAIAHQREYALSKHNHTYGSDDEALDDYISLHWAYWVEEL
jgi:hypothetical protein